MARLLIGAGLILALFVALLAFGGGDPAPAPQGRAGAEQVEPPPWAEWLGRATAAFAPAMALPEGPFRLAEGEARELRVAPWEGDGPRIARFGLTAGAALVTWRCNDPRREDCTQELCLAPGPARPVDCPEEARPRREGSVAGDASGGVVRLRGLAEGTVIERR